jgi:hypothetical protein
MEASEVKERREEWLFVYNKTKKISFIICRTFKPLYKKN